MPPSQKRYEACPPEVNLTSIRGAIPKEMFKQNTVRALSYIVRDCCQVAATYLIWTKWVEPTVFPSLEGNMSWFAAMLVRFALWNVYWWAQGMNFTALWVAGGHEAGHGAVSSNKTINEVVGFIFHTFLLVPYHAWRVSHATHHSFTNHLGLDTVFVPKGLSEPMREAIDTAPIVNFLYFFGMLTLGWPLYLAVNIAGQNFGRRTNHFETTSPLFKAKDKWAVIVSNIGIVAMLGLLAVGVNKTSVWNVFAHYGAPYLWTNAWLVYITFMHHHDVRIPHYDDKNFNFVRGALCSVDRDYGWLTNAWLHHINDSHVAHHLFSDMPWFNAIKITPILKQHLGQYYASDNRDMVTQTTESWVKCQYVIPSEGVTYFRS